MARSPGWSWRARGAALGALLLLGAADAATEAAAPGAAPANGDADIPDTMAQAKPDLQPQNLFVDKADLKAIRARGTLRFLVEGAEESHLARAGLPPSLDRVLAREFAERNGVQAEFVLVPGLDQAIPMLLEGKADVAATGLTVTDTRRQLVAFARPMATVSEVLVGRKGAANPRRARELSGREVHVRASSSFADSLEEVRRSDAQGLRVTALPEALDQDAAAWEVGLGKIPLTVLDSNVLEAVLSYNDQVEPLFDVARGRQIAWAVRPANKDLKSALDQFFVEKALTQHTEERFTGDLDGLTKRGSLRVLVRNNQVSYFLHRGQRFGFDFELAQLLAKSLKLRLEMVVAPAHDQLVPWLLEGRGDVIGAAYTVTSERAKQVAFSRPYLQVDELLVERAGAKARTGAPGSLQGLKIHVRRSSSYHATLLEVQERLGPFEIVPAAEDMETDELVERVERGEIEATVADSHILEVERAWGAKVAGTLNLTRPPGAVVAKARASGPARTGDEGAKQIAFAVRPGSRRLLAAIDGFLRKAHKGVEYNVARKRYFEDRRFISQVANEWDRRNGRLSPYDPILRKYAREFGFDWRLMASQAFQESGFDPQAKSWVGARGLFQVMPATGADMGFHDLEDPDQGAHAGMMYMYKLVQQLDPNIKFKHRVRMALAAYNAGLGHVIDARRLAAEQGLDPNRWFGHVEKAMLLLEKPQHARRARHGYCRGSEPVNYVSQIQNRYDNWVLLVDP